VRNAAAGTLGKIGDSRAAEPLAVLLKDPDLSVRTEAATALAAIGAPAVDPLVAALKNEDAAVRGVAADILGRIKAPRAVEPLVSALTDKEPSVRRKAADSLASIGAPAVDPLIAALQDKDLSVLTEAARALGAIGDPEAEKALLDALKDKNVEVIAGAYSFFIRKSISGSEDLLIQALNRYGTRILWMAQDFQDCGHPPLVNAVKKWAAENSYRIDPSSGHSGPKWVTSSDKTPSIDLLKWK